MAKKWKRSYVPGTPGKKMEIFIYNPNEEGCSAQLIRTNGSDLSRSNFIPFAIISPPTVIILPLGFSCQCHFNNIGSSSHAVHRYQVMLMTKHVLNYYIENFIAFIICHKWLLNGYSPKIFESLIFHIGSPESWLLGTWGILGWRVNSKQAGEEEA